MLLFHEWFQGMPLNWIRMASKKARTKLETAIGFDQVMREQWYYCYVCASMCSVTFDTSKGFCCNVCFLCDLQQVDVDLKDDLRFSSSAIDVKSFLLQVGSFWKNLEWPVPEQAYGYLCTVIEVSITILKITVKLRSISIRVSRTLHSTMWIPCTRVC